MQNLIMPINKAFVTASFRNEKYKKKFGFEHYGVDFGGKHTVWSSGYGICIFKGECPLYGKYVTVFYPDVDCPEIRHKYAPNESSFVFANYFHLSDAYARPGETLTKDSAVGISGETGQYATGPHLHLEMFHLNYLPTAQIAAFRSPSFAAMPNAFFNPLSLLHVKSTRPDNQSIKFSGDGYTNKEDELRVY